MKITAFWYVTLCSLIDRYQRLKGTCYFYLQGRRVEAAGFSKIMTMASQITWHHIPEDRNLHCHGSLNKFKTLFQLLTHNFPKSSIALRCRWEWGRTCGCPSRRTLCRTWQNFHATIRLSCKGSRSAHTQNVCAPFSWKVPIIVPGTQLKTCTLHLASCTNMTMQYGVLKNLLFSMRGSHGTNVF
jgi:hypothetical protein